MKAADIDRCRLCGRINLAATRLNELGDDLQAAGWDDVADDLCTFAEDAYQLVRRIHEGPGEYGE